MKSCYKVVIKKSKRFYSSWVYLLPRIYTMNGITQSRTPKFLKPLEYKVNEWTESEKGRILCFKDCDYAFDWLRVMFLRHHSLLRKYESFAVFKCEHSGLVQEDILLDLPPLLNDVISIFWRIRRHQNSLDKFHDILVITPPETFSTKKLKLIEEVL